jgi:predicted tellurium resistance membrane protein TerC
LLTDSEEAAETGEADSIATAIRLIVLADLTMSLDNILAVAAVAEKSDHSLLVLLVGLTLSIPIVLIGGDVVARLMGRLPALVWIGAAVLGYTAGELIVEDKVIDGVADHVIFSGVVIPVAIAALVLAIGWRLSDRRILGPA